VFAIRESPLGKGLSYILRSGPPETLRHMFAPMKLLETQILIIRRKNDHSYFCHSTRLVLVDSMGVAKSEGFLPPHQGPFVPTVILAPQFKKSHLQRDGCTDKCVRIPNWRTSEVWVIFSSMNGVVLTRIFRPKRDEVTGG
jgi:hypothetical protein